MDGPSTAFLLAALGAHAASRFAERMAVLDLTSPHAGLLRLIARRPGQSQQALAHQLGTAPSRLVALVDTLAERGAVERRRNTDDRRLHALHVTPAGEELLHTIGAAGKAHDDEVCAGLTDAERDRLGELLSRIAARQGLTPGVHPGFRKL